MSKHDMFHSMERFLCETVHSAKGLRGDYTGMAQFRTSSGYGTRRTVSISTSVASAGRRNAGVKTRAFLDVFKSMASKASPRSPESKAADEAMRRLLGAIGPTERGTKMGKDSRAEITACLDELKALSAGAPVDKQLLDGTWRLVWTSEKEILGIIKEGGIASWFGTTAGDVLQVIDLPNNRLQNCIEFPPEGAFLVDSFIQFDDDEEQKCSFKFSGAALKTNTRTIKLPPMGKSRFRTLYVSAKHRVAFDDRGDYLVVERLGVPRDLYREYGI